MSQDFTRNTFGQLADQTFEPPARVFAEVQQRRGFFNKLGNRLYVHVWKLGALALVVTVMVGYGFLDRSTAPESGTVNALAPATPIVAQIAPVKPAPVESEAVAVEVPTPATNIPSTLPAAPLIETTTERATTPLTEVKSELQSVLPLVEAPGQKNNLTTLDLRTATALDLDLPEPMGCYWGKGGGTDVDVAVEVLGGGFYDFMTLSARLSENAAYADTRNATESAWYGYGASVRVSALFGSGFAVRSGIDYQQINEQFDYSTEEETRVTIEQIFDVEGNLIGLDTITEIGLRTVQWTNQYRQLGIPLLLGYEKDFGNFMITFNGGIVANILSRQRGRILNIDNEVVSIDSDDPDAIDAYRPLVGVSFVGSIGFNYALRNDLHFVVEPQFRHYLNSFTKDSYAVEHEHQNLGLMLGLRKTF